MKSGRLAPLLPFLVVLLSWTSSTCSDNAGNAQANRAASGSAHQASPDLTGTWSGTLASKDRNPKPIPISIVISPNAKGTLFAVSSLASDCIKDPHLHVSITGSVIVLAGSDADGDSLTLRGTLDKSGTVLTMTYIANGSASGRCQTTNGTGVLRRGSPLH